MKKILLSSFFKKLILNIILVMLLTSNAKAATYVSLAPCITDIIYALKADKNLIGVPDYYHLQKGYTPKPKIGSPIYVNKEKILALKPDYLFALTCSRPMVGEMNYTSTKPIYFDFRNLDEIYSSILTIGKYTNSDKEAQTLVANLKFESNKYKTKHPKRILYLIQTSPFISVGSTSYVTELIKKSGHVSVTANIKTSYPNVTAEFIVNSHPDLVVLSFPTDIKLLRKIVGGKKIIILNPATQDIIDRPGINTVKAIRYFSNL